MYRWACPECDEQGREATRDGAEFRLFIHLMAKTKRSSKKMRGVAARNVVEVRAIESDEQAQSGGE